mmetsp:Transcript_19861/g.46450  ORF Transcript_19861/g.46450 Transcript_19861/m.46450 type:complete len:314 (+) Transcript_19861:29-970(+)
MGASVGCSQCVASREHDLSAARSSNSTWPKSSHVIHAADMNLAQLPGPEAASTAPSMACRTRTRQMVESPRTPSAAVDLEEKMRMLLELPGVGLYQGQLHGHLAHGSGALQYLDGSSYDGQWSLGYASGFGRFTWKDGSIYEGRWCRDQQDGSGKEMRRDGSSFEGSFRQGKRCQGKAKWVYGWYEGDFQDNMAHGQGLLTWTDGRTYRGAWVKNEMDGQGEASWPDGRRYKGAYYKDKRHGHGCFSWPDGRQYCGQWEQGRQHGSGRVLLRDQQVREGVWCGGQRVKWLSEARPFRLDDGFLEALCVGKCRF